MDAGGRAAVAAADGGERPEGQPHSRRAPLHRHASESARTLLLS